MFRTKAHLFFFVFPFFLAHQVFATTYYSQNSNTPTNTTNWNSARGGTGSAPANFTSGDLFVIQNGHSMNPAVAWTVSGTGAEIQVESGGTLNVSTDNVTSEKITVDAGGNMRVLTLRTITVNNGNASGHDVLISGTFANSSNAPGLTYGSGATGIINNGGIYQHAQDGGTVSTFTWATGSTCEITGCVSIIPSGTGQSFYHFTWNCAGQIVATPNLSGSFSQNIAGNFTIQNTGGQSIYLSNGSSNTLTLGGDLIVMSGATFGLSNGNGLPVINLAGNLTVDGTLTENIANATGYGTINFTNSSSKTFSKSGTISNVINFTVNNGATIDFGTSVLSGSGTFTLSSGGGMVIGEVNGIAASASSGNIQVTGARSYSIGGNYTFNGTSSQVFGDGLPTRANNLTINNGNTNMALNATFTVNGTLTLTSGRLSIGANTLNLNGNFSGSATNSLRANGSSSILSIAGSGVIGTIYFDQSTPGTTNRIHNLVYLRSSQTITLGNTLEVTGAVTPTAGTLASAGNLVLISDAAGTARIAAGSGSYLTGDIRVQTYISSVGRRWRYLASPVSNATLEDWRGEIFLTGNNSPSADQSTTVGGQNWGFDATASNTPSVYYYDETVITGDQDDGWVPVTNSTSSLTNIPLTVGKGYRVFVRGDRNSLNRLNGVDNTQNAVTLNLTGPANSGTAVMPVSFTSSGTSAHDGWCLLGNVYPAPYDWDTYWNAGNVGNSGTNYSNIDPSIYIFDATSGSYKSYNAFSHTGTLAGGIIPLGGSFFVQATAASPSMSLVEAYKSTGTPASLFKTAPGSREIGIKLILDSVNSDDCIVSGQEPSSKGYDRGDILKLTNQVVNVSTLASDWVDLAVSVRPFSTGASDTIALVVKGEVPHMYTLSFTIDDSIVRKRKIYLVDHFANTSTDLRQNKTYSFYIDPLNPLTQGKERFTLILTPEATGTGLPLDHVHPDITLYPNPTCGLITVQHSGAALSCSSYDIMDVSARVLSSINWEGTLASSSTIDLSALSAGVYFIRFNLATGAKVVKILKGAEITQ